MHPRLIEIKKQIGKFVANFAVTEENGRQYIFDGDIVREGLEVSTYDENGDIVPLSDGEYAIKGVKVRIAEGKVIEILEKESRIEASEDTDGGNAAQTEQTPGMKNEYEALKAEYAELKAKYEALKAEYEEAKNKPMGVPVPQRTDMSAHVGDIPEDVKGTKYEKAWRILGNH